MLRKINFSTIAVIIVIAFSNSASACDDKACESAYLASTQQYVNNYKRRAESYRTERQAYAKIRENRAYALYVHMHLMIFGDKPSNDSI